MAGLLKVISEKKGIFLCGAGVAKATSQHKFADWNGLIEDGIYTCRNHSFGKLGEDWVNRKLQDVSAGDVIEKISVASQVTERMRGTGIDTFKIWVENTIGILTVKSNTLIKALGALQLPILTTNYDNLIEQVLMRDIVTWKSPEICARILKGNADGVLHLHGCWKDPESLVFDYNSYEQIVANNFVQTFLKILEFSHSMIFVGMGEGIHDPNFRGFLTWAKGAFLNSQTAHYLLVKEGEAPTGLPDSIRTIVYGKTHADLPGYLRGLSGAGKSSRSIWTTSYIKRNYPKPLRLPPKATDQPAAPSDPVLSPDGQIIMGGHKVDKVLQDTKQNLDEMKDIIVLSVLQRMDKELLAAYWKEDLAEKLIYLENKHNFFTNGVLNKEIWSNWRTHWRNHPDFTYGVISKFEEIIDWQSRSISFEDDAYYNWYTHCLNIRSWKTGTPILPELLKGFLVGLLKGEDIQPIIELADEIQSSNATEKEMKTFLSDKASLSFASLKPEYKELLFLESQSVAGWQPYEKAYLYLLLAYHYSERKEYSIGLHYFDLAFPLLDVHLPQAGILENAYLDAVAAVFISPIGRSQMNTCMEWIRKFTFNAACMHKGIAKTLYMAEEYESAVIFWGLQLEESPDDLQVRGLLIKTLSFHLGRHKEAIEIFNTAPESAKKISAIYLQAASAHWKLKQYKHVERIYKQALQGKHVSKCNIHRLLGELYSQKLDNFRSARKHFIAALAEKGTTVDLLTANASYLELLTYTKKNAEAISLISPIEELINRTYSRMSIDRLNGIAWNLYKLNHRLDLAERLSMQSVEPEGDKVHAYHTLASILVRRGKCDRAQFYMSKWLDYTQDSLIKSYWNNYSMMFQDLIVQHKQAVAEEWLKEEDSSLWLMIRWALRKSTGKPQIIPLSEDLLPLAQIVYAQLVGKEVPNQFPSTP